MDSTFLVMLVLMTVFLVIFIAYLFYLLMKWNRISKEEKLKNSPTVKTEGDSVVKVPTPKYRLEVGGGYFMFDKGSAQGYKLVKAYLARGYEAVTVTHFKPRGLRKRLAPQESEFIWLSREKPGDHQEYEIVAPTNLGFVLQELEDRLGGENLIVFIDCLERIYKDNDMNRSDKFLKNLKKLVGKKDAVLLMSIEATGTNRKTRDFLHSTFSQLGKKKKGTKE